MPETLNILEPAYLQDLRKRNETDFIQAGFPNSHLEDWKYTPVHKYLPKNSVPDQIPFELSYKQVPQDFPFSTLDAYKLYFLNGEFQENLSDIPGKEWEILPIQKSFENPDFQRLLDSLSKERKDSFLSLNLSKMNKGIWLRVKKGNLVEKPVHLIHFYSGTSPEIQHSRNLIQVEPFGEWTLLESHSSLDKNPLDLFFNEVSEIFLGQGSQMEHIRYQAFGKNQRFLSTHLAGLDQHSIYRSHVYSLSGTLIRNNLQINLSESESETHLYGFYSLHDQELMDNHTLVKHLKPHCQSNELYKGVLDGKSIGVFNGRVEVSQDAQKTNAYQQNQTILLSSEATMNSKPELEIFADDVKCSHGSTMGQLDPSALFYLKSRGISDAKAKKMMVNAFAFSLVSEIKNEAISDELEERIHDLIQA